jgi:small subunit ribosomal protein S17
MSEETQNDTTEETPQAEETPAVEEAATETAPADDAPALEEERAAEAEAETAAAPVEPEPKRKRKRVPRAQRRQRPKPVRERPSTRKPITRTPRAESERGRRQERRGVVVSDAMDKTIVVKVDVVRKHPRYQKVIRRSTKFHAHDERNEAHVGDVVRIVETRPVSATKRWRLAEVVEAAR